MHVVLVKGEAGFSEISRRVWDMVCPVTQAPQHLAVKAPVVCIRKPAFPASLKHTWRRRNQNPEKVGTSQSQFFLKLSCFKRLYHPRPCQVSREKGKREATEQFSTAFLSGVFSLACWQLENRKTAFARTPTKPGSWWKSHQRWGSGLS